MALKYQSILVAIDGSKEAEWAFKKGIEMAKRNNSSLLLTHVIDTRTFAMVEAYDRSIAEKADNLATELLQEYQKIALEAGVKKVEYVIDFGSPKIIIPKEIAKKHKIDLIICGATGMNAVERFLIGSVSENITRHAPCDVLVVRTGKDS
ncbi:universal stress protein UspA [Bacillus sp. MUM 116]|uniref:Universal stress protein n=1 Tax=Bacillus xiapuensis TaxID=2014075 RepID=A0ABU6N736_9BACI|nr:MULTISPECIES: universal stress protein [Bacillus]MED3561829.1 universal stress protein [Bacillus xiapuensis]OIK16900.1 universal stress protein UspA [Bacillus sp. MUM 116]